MLLKTILTPDDVARIVEGVSSRQYDGNLTCATRDDGKARDSRRKVRFTLGVRDSFALGARTAASGRHMPKASWQAHRDVMDALYCADPLATLQTALATYQNAEHFRATFEATGDRNVGSNFAPARLRDTAVQS